MRDYLLIKLKKILPFIFIGFLLGCENDLAEVQRFISTEEVAIEIGKDVEIIYSDSAQVKIIIEAPLLHRHLDKKEPRREFPDGFMVNFYNEKKKTNSQLTSKYAIQYENSKEIIARDSVVLQNPQQKLETEELIWEEDNERIHSDKFVKITTADEVITGFGFEADQEFTHWTINIVVGNVKFDKENKF